MSRLAAHNPLAPKPNRRGSILAKATRHIRHHLRASTAVAALLDEIERREQLLSMIRRHLPDKLAMRCRQATLVAGELTLYVDSPVWIDRFRFLGMDLVPNLAAQGVEVETCRARVLPAGSSVPGPEGLRRKPDTAPVQSDQAPSGSKLSRALMRLGRTLGAR
jgi:hypothetical protein